MDALDKAGELAEGTRKDLLLNEVVLIVPLDNAKGIKSFDDIVTSNVTHIALGEPKGVPVGQYSEEVFKSMHIMDQAAGKAVYASDVRQVLAWVESGEADCGSFMRRMRRYRIRSKSWRRHQRDRISQSSILWQS